jgi:hypothetical protein
MDSYLSTLPQVGKNQETYFNTSIHRYCHYSFTTIIKLLDINTRIHHEKKQL